MALDLTIRAKAARLASGSYSYWFWRMSLAAERMTGRRRAASLAFIEEKQHRLLRTDWAVLPMGRTCTAYTRPEGPDRWP